jgi:prepilin-type N-terminal cleavage/methylation domain-containing protein
MLQNIKKRTEGFTIIEVLIVLAIAGLILLIVFLAVPALQRNSRNTQIKNDAAAVAGAISEFESNNSGAVPTLVSQVSGVWTVSGGTGTTSATFKVNGSTTISSSTTGATGPSATTYGTIQVDFGYACNGNTLGTSNNRASAILYSIESGGGAQQCVQS